MSQTSRKEREFKRREREILNAALDLFSGERWESVTVEQIAERAEVGKGTVYNHFASKDEIYARLAMEFYREVLAVVEQQPDGNDPAREMSQALRAALWYHARHEEYRNVRQYVFRAGFWERLDVDLIAEFEQLDEGFRNWAARRLEQGMGLGCFREQSVDSLMTGLDAIFSGAVDQLWGGRCWHRLEPEAYIDAIVEFVASALKS